MSFDSPAFRTRVASHPQGTFDELETFPKHYSLNFEQTLNEMLTDGWERHGTRLPSLMPPVAWDNPDRSFTFHLHAWEPLVFLLKGHCTVANSFSCERYFTVSFNYALDWLTHFQLPIINNDPALLLEESNTEASGFAWYDMAVGQRIYQLAYILDTICRDQRYDDATVTLLYKALHFHHRLLSLDGFFKHHSNHGLYQALGQLAAAKRFLKADELSERYFALATKRLSDLLSSHFTADNVHKEHSPGYHYMVLGSLTGANHTGLILDRTIVERIHSMEEALSWMIKPNYCLVTFGDTDPRSMGRTPQTSQRFKHPALQAVLSKGNIGVFPGPHVQMFKDAGYVFARLYADGVEPVFPNASYLAQIAAFHSRVHKHADHLSFVWFDRHRDILIDAGRFAYAGRTSPDSELFKQGFWYSHPKRIYCESTRAHNTVGIDGKSFPRARVRPFGSALLFASEIDGCAVTYCEATHFRNIRHHRQLIMKPGHFLLVLDWLYDRKGITHEYRQHFHFAPEWSLENKDDGILGSHPGCNTTASLNIRVASLIPEGLVGPIIRGQHKPELLGWTSDAANSLVPTSCFDVSQISSSQCSFATIFVFGKTLDIDRGATRFNRTLSAGKISWKDELGHHVLPIKQPQ
jgi:hypothetical protein